MQKAKLSWLFILNVFLIIVLMISLAKPVSVQSALADDIVISEVQTGAGDSDFIELYNPTGSDVNLEGWQLTKMPFDGAPETNLVASLSGSIPSHGYFLIANENSTFASSSNLTYASSIADNNTVSLYTDSTRGTLVDRVGMGTAVTSETSPAQNPGAGQSIERKANSGSTADSMTSGADVNGGNGEDTNNNSNDFILRLASEPQNSTSSAEIPTASPGPSATESASPSPTEEPSASPSASPSEEPSASPSAEPSEEPSASPSASPSEEPSASPSASVSPSPSASASATPQPSHKPKLKVSCSFEPQTFKFGKWEFTFKALYCKLIRV